MPPEPRAPRSGGSAARAYDAARRASGLEGASTERRRRLARRLLPTLLALGVVAFVLGLIAAGGQSAEERIARDYAAALQRGNYEAMYGLLTAGTRDQISLEAFADAHRRAAATATAVRFEPGRAEDEDDGARVPVSVVTRAFGTIQGSLFVPIAEERVSWRPEMAFPGLRPGEALTRRTRAPRRARISARNGARIVSGPADAREVGGGAAASIAGSMGPPETDSEREALYARGFPEDTPIGRTGLERALEPQVAGRPGGELLAGERRLASSTPEPAGEVRSTIDLDVQAAADQALAGRLGGIAAIDPRTGKIRALAGIAFSAPQPPGSVFKIITASAALEEGIVKPSTTFPVETQAILDGVPLENANGESCGGSFTNSFAHSCNSVFAPLGVKLGAERLVEAAERFGFNEPPGIPGAAESTIPPAAAIEGPLAVGSTAIGQGKVLTTPLLMAQAAATIASGGVRHEPTLVEGTEPAPPERVIPEEVARTVERLMVEVVETGTGTAAAIDSVKVAGKTGTAELRSTAGPAAENPATGEQDPGSDTDAWFAAFAPARRPRLAVGVLFVQAGAGGETAAPVARTVLQAALGG
jgi:hypothetical protein